MNQIKKVLSLLVFVLIYVAVNAQSNDTLFYRHSFQFNIAGLVFQRYGIAYELRLNPQHAIFIQGGGSFPHFSEEKEYGFGLHYKYFFRPVKDAKFLWLFQSAYKNSFGDLNVRYMNLDGIYNDAQYLYEVFFIGVVLGRPGSGIRVSQSVIG